MERVEILGVNVNSLTMAEAVEAVETFIEKGERRLIATANAEMIMRATYDEELKNIFENLKKILNKKIINDRMTLEKFMGE